MPCSLAPGAAGPSVVRAFAVFGIALGRGGATGLAGGGWLLTLDPLGLGWRSVSLVNLPVGIAIPLAAARLAPETTRRPGTRLDLPGAWIGRPGKPRGHLHPWPLAIEPRPTPRA